MNTTVDPMSGVPHRVLGRSKLMIPPVIYGTSCLGNLYKAIPFETKKRIVGEFFRHTPSPVALDSAGKYGAGLSLESIGRSLRELKVSPRDVVISNKLGWYRVPLKGSEPTFEPGAWMGLEHDAEQRIDGEGILECWRQGCELLGAPYVPQMVSVHDPDEYLAKVSSDADAAARWRGVVDAYASLQRLRAAGETAAVGVGAKDWTVVRRIADAVDLDWVMFACSLTIMQHPKELLEFIESLRRRGVGIINSAVFHAGFLTGGEYFDYRKLDPSRSEDRVLFVWRERFAALCRTFEVKPAAACVRFALSPPGVAAVALNTSNPERVRENYDLATVRIPSAFWSAMKEERLIDRNYPHL
jgi:D-threo-aldose 1-dehydrogenase